jgi:hypothetical protein
MTETLKRLCRTTRRVPVLKRFAPSLELLAEYPRELLLLKGVSTARSTRPSAVLFTVHKAASVYVARLLKRLAADSGLSVIDFAGYRFKGGRMQPGIFDPGELARKIYRPQGHLYGPFRTFNPAIPDLDRFRIVLNLRDPRDVLVSAYFSMAYSHYVPDRENPDAAKRILADREAALQADIDPWVLENASSVGAIFADYSRNLLGRPNVFLAKYEKLVTDFDGWLQEVTAFLDLQPSAALLDELRRGAVFDVEEDVNRHKRQVTPGDHKRKLKPETIAQLNAILGDVLDQLQYPR